MVEIPTGEGKTEGALLWASSLITNQNTKIIYTMLTAIASNKLFERISLVFGANKCALVHNSSKIFLEEKYDDNYQNMYEKEFIFAKTFNKPVTVCTVYFGRFNIVFKNYLNFVVIIDEIHSYGFKLLGFLKRFFEIAKDLDIKICIMSATLSNKTKKYLNLANFKSITQSSLFYKKPNKIIKKEKFLEDDIDFTLSKCDKNVLIIKNSINGAINLYEKLKARELKKYNALPFKVQKKRQSKKRK